MTNLKTINIKGKSYVEVSERLKYFRNNYKDYSLTTQIIECTSDQCVMVANVVDRSYGTRTRNKELKFYK